MLMCLADLLSYTYHFRSKKLSVFATLLFLPLSTPKKNTSSQHCRQHLEYISG